MGDTGGIGPELAIGILNEYSLREKITPILYGPGRALGIYRKMLQVEKFNYNIIENPGQAQPKKISLIDTGPRIDRMEIGVATQTGGEAAVRALEAAVRDLKKGEIDFLVTMPIDKNTTQSDQFPFPGHTEYLASSYNSPDVLMMMVHDEMRMGVVTSHIPLHEVSSKLTKELIIAKIKTMQRSLQVDFDLPKPRIAVLGLNPHGSDSGMFGNEEKEIIEPAVKHFSKDNAIVMGPFSPDGFFGSGKFSRFDGIIAMYHDQGLIPFKLLAGFEGVNFTAGIPAVRTSPDHGVAYDIAGKGRADLTSARNALYFAYDIFMRRNTNEDIQAHALRPVRRWEAVEDEAVPTQEELATGTGENA